MKTIFKFCAAAALVISTANAAFAADTADLKVQGTLIMGSCTPSLSGGGVVDYGKISVKSLSTTDFNQLGTKEVTLSLTCDSPTKAAWTIVDDRADSAIDTDPVVGNSTTTDPLGEFGLGTTSAGIKLGSYGVDAMVQPAPTVDGVSGFVGSSVDAGKTWKLVDSAVSGGQATRNDGTRLISYSDASGQPVAFTTASEVLQIGASLQNTTTLAIADDTALDGQATISVVYL